MRYAADRDAVARQWANGFEEVFEWFVPRLIALRAEWEQLDRAVAAAHVEWIASHGDSLICRKCGPETNEQARRLAAQALEQLPRGWDAFESAVGELDFGCAPMVIVGIRDDRRPDGCGFVCRFGSGRLEV
jgi:triphosphoribosyl-dephospho-CoA synthase